MDHALFIQPSDTSRGRRRFLFLLQLSHSLPLCASSLDSYDEVVRKYKKARSNLDTLKRLGASLLHRVDATKLQLHPHLNCRRFDRIIFNFPHAGFHGKETDSKLIKKHRELVFGFLHGASHIVKADGEVHVSHKNKAPFCHWKLEELASKCFLALTQKQQLQGVSQRAAHTFGLSYHLGQVHNPLVPYQEHRSRPHIEDTIASSIRAATQRPATFNYTRFQENSMQLDPLRYIERSSRDFLLQPSHHPPEERFFLECSSRFGGVPLDICIRRMQSTLTQTSFPHLYTGESQEGRLGKAASTFTLHGSGD